MKTKLLYLFWALPGLLMAFAAAGQSKWVNSYGALSQDEALCSDRNGNDYFVGGYLSQGAQIGTSSIQNNGFSDGFLTKLNGNGDIAWTVSLGGPSADRILDVDAHANGTVAVTGFITGNVQLNGTSVPTNAGSQDAFAMLCDANGTPLWIVPFGGSDADTGYGIAIDDDGNVLCTGQFKGVAQFGPFTLTSEISPLTNTYTHDLFVVKISPAGQILWARQGAANADDRGLGICSDPAGNAYLVGQSSDTLQFGNTSYPNTVFNSGFVLKIDANGNEAWLTRIASTQTLINEIEYGGDNHLYLTGDHLGQMAVLSAGSTQLFPSSNDYNIFLGKFDLNGAPVWISSAGSSSEVSSKALAEGDNGEWYIAGTFKCRFDDFSALYGDGVFYSLGFRDLFVARYNADGTRAWERNYGSPKDDFCAAVAYGAADDPLFFGSYGRILQFPDGDGFGNGDDAIVPSWSDAGNYCNSNNYGQVQAVTSVGGLDIFMARAVLVDEEPFDWFNRAGQSGCERDFRTPCIGSDACPDTLAVCGLASVYAYLRTQRPELGGPEIDWEWTGNIGFPTDDSLWVQSMSDQWVHFHIERNDGCYTAHDSVYTDLQPIPNPPLISDDVVVNTECSPCVNILLCEEQAITLTASGITETNFGWSVPGGEGQTAITVSGEGEYVLSQTNAFGCSASTQIDIDLAQAPDTVAPHIVWFADSEVLLGDTVGLCPSDDLRFVLKDTLNSNPGVDFSYGLVLWTVFYGSEQVEEVTQGSGDPYYLEAVADGWHIVHATYTEVFCDEPVQTYPLLIDSLYIELYPGPEVNVNLDGPVLLCPGGSVLLSAEGAETYTWSGPNYTVVAPDTIEVFAPGIYGVSHAVINEFGCEASDFDGHTVNAKIAYAAMLPANGIVCPFDSVMLFTEIPHLSYQWIGPMGELLGTEQTQWASVPGFYHCQVVDVDSCYLETNFLELKEYSSPYLDVFPGTDLCVNGEVQLTLATNDEAAVQWMAPLSGSNLQQTIDQPGTYTVQSTLCGITESLDVTIVITEVPAEITIASELPACPGDTVLLVANPGMNLYNWSPGGFLGQQIGVTEPGEYGLTTVDAQGCLGFAEPVEVTFTDVSAEVVGAPEFACPGDVIVLEATGTGDFEWYFFGADEQLGVGSSIEVTMGDGPVSIGVTSTVEECESAATVVEVDIHPSAFAIEIEGDSVFCEGDAVVLASNSGEVFWSGPAGSYTGQAWVLGAAVPGWSGSYSASYPDNLCGADAIAFEVIIDPTPPTPTAIDTLACLGSSITLTSSYGGGTLWYNPESGTTTAGEALTLTDLTEAIETWYQVISENGCEGEAAPVVVDVPFAGETLTITAPEWVCEGDELVLTASVAADSYLWSTPQDVVEGGVSLVIPEAGPEMSGSYEVVAAIGPCSMAGDAVVVEVVDVPSTLIDPLAIACDNGSVVLQAPEFLLSPLWNGSEEGESFTVDTGGWQYLEGSIAPGCAAMDSVFVESPGCGDGQANIFTPNGDGVNDVYDFSGWSYSIETVQIYNRWGHLVRELTGNLRLWDGRNANGQAVSDGVYFVIVTSRIPINGEHSLTGTVYVRR